MNRNIVGALATLLLATGAASGPAAAQGFQLPPLLLQSDAFPDGGVVPDQYSFRGGNLQPGFRISNAPEKTQTYAIIFHDIDVAIGGKTDDVPHWVAWNIPGTTKEIPEGRLPEGSVIGKNIQGQNSYMGPGAPPSPRFHHYVFEVYALDSNLDLPPTAGRTELLAAMQGKVVAKSAYVGRFQGKAPPAGAAPPAAGAPPPR